MEDKLDKLMIPQLVKKFLSNFHIRTVHFDIIKVLFTHLLMH